MNSCIITLFNSLISTKGKTSMIYDVSSKPFYELIKQIAETYKKRRKTTDLKLRILRKWHKTSGINYISWQALTLVDVIRVCDR